MIVEVNGIKLEVDERTARTIESYKIGDPIKVLVKQYGDQSAIYPGMIVNFYEFKDLPTIEIAYLEIGYSRVELKFAPLNSQSTGVQIAPATALELSVSKEDIQQMMENEIMLAQSKVDELRRKRDYFLNFMARHMEVREQVQ